MVIRFQFFDHEVIRIGIQELFFSGSYVSFSIYVKIGEGDGLQDFTLRLFDSFKMLKE